MNKNIKLFILSAIIALLSQGCSMEYDNYNSGVYLNGPYVQCYYDGELALTVNSDPTGGLPYLSAGVNLNSDVPVTEYYNGSQTYCDLCQKHSDTLFDGEDFYYSNPAKLCFAHDLVSINFVSDSDYDASHPAGASLLDIMNYSATSLTRWIKKGYPMDSYQADCYILDKNAATLEPEDLSMLCYFNLFQLQFLTAPTTSGAHNFTLTITCDDGTVKTLSARVAF